jgi:competence protein ComEC
MRMRLLGLVSGLLCSGIAPAIPPASTLAALALLSACLLLFRAAPARVLWGFALGCLIGFGHGQMVEQRRLPQHCVGEILQVSGLVRSLPQRRTTSFGGPWQQFSLTVSSIAPKSCAGPGRLLLSYYGEQAFLPGERLTLQFKAKRPWGLANPGSPNYQSWYREQGIDAVGSVQQKSVVSAGVRAMSLTTRLQHFRLSLKQRIGQVDLSLQTRQILRALTVADKSGIDRPLRELFVQFGVSHLLVISGLHIGLAATAGYLLCRILLLPIRLGAVLRFRLQAVLGLLVALVYAGLAGFSIPAQRAVVMLACFVLAQCVSRPSSALDRLLIAASIVLLMNPLAGIGVGFWLSFGSVGMLLWFVQWRTGRSRPAKLTAVHLYMAMVMLPLSAFYFQEASMVSAVSNLVMIPVIGFWVVPLALLAALAFCLGSSVDSLLWFLSGLPVQWLIGVLQDISWATQGQILLQRAVDMPTMILGLLSAALLCVPGGWRHRLPACLVLLLLGLPARNMTAFSDAESDASLRVTVLDVGQGTSVVVTKGGRALVYDTGGGNPAGTTRADAVLLPYLRRLGVEQLDSLIVSHADLDHSAGARALTQALPIQRIRYGPGEVIDGLQQGRTCVAGESWRWPGGPVFKILSPAEEPRPGRNNGSCVLQVEQGDYRYLFAGDIESGRERELVAYWRGDLASNWLLAAHHGSRTSTSWTFLKHVAPQTVVASSGYANHFKHPHPWVVDRVQASGSLLLETAKEGALEFRLLPDGQVQYSAWRRLVQRYWL